MFSVLLIVFGLSFGCTSRGEGDDIDLSAEGTAKPVVSIPGEQRETLVLVVAAVNSPFSAFEAYDSLARYLGSRLGMEARVIGSKTYAEVNSLVRSGSVTLAVTCTAAYVNGHDEFGMEALVAPVVGGESVYYSYLILGKDSPWASWKDLRGHSFAFSDPMSNSGHLVPLFELWKMGEVPGSFFSQDIFTYSHQNSVRAVAKGLTYAGAVDSLVYDYMLARGDQDAINTRVVWKSSPYGIPPLVVNPALDRTTKETLRETLLQMDADDEGKRILGRLKFDRFVPARSEERRVGKECRSRWSPYH